MIQKLREGESDIGLITNPSLEPLEFLKEIAYQFGLIPQSGQKVDLWNMIKTRMIDNETLDKNTVLIVDEAQLISRETFEEIRLLLNFQLNDRFLLTLILIGQPELRDIIHDIKQLEQRIAIKYHLNPLAKDEAVKYIAFRLRKAGTDKQIFAPDTLDEIYRASEGVPRKLNNICDMALMVGFISKAGFVDLAMAQKVIKDVI